MEYGKMVGARELYAIEIQEWLVEEARKRGINAFVADACKKFPFENEYFDVITANQILEHVLDTDNMLRECHRVLKKYRCCCKKDRAIGLP